MKIVDRVAARVRDVLKPAGSDAAVPQAAPAPAPIAPFKPSIKLKFTGSCSEAEFQARCKENSYWYHTYHFDNGFSVRGDYDIGRDVAGYGFPETMTGLSVLDIGTGSGWFATYFEQQGADVTVVDARGYCDFDMFGRDHYPDVISEKPVPDAISPDGRPLYFSPVSKGFWVMKELLGLKARYTNGRVYQVSPELFGGRKFDLVFMGSVLMHVRDPIGALMAAHSVCKGRVITTTYMLADETATADPVMWMREGAADGISWWVPNRACLTQWLKAAGFSSFDIEKTVTLTADNPYKDIHGRSSAVDQVQQLVHAQV